MNLIERYKKPTPKFFRVLRNIGIALGSSGAAILAAPVVIPVALLTVATYLTVAGAVLTAVSQAVVEQMARGAQQLAAAQYSVAVSGVAGPAGGSPEKPVGTVWLAWADADQVQAGCWQFAGDRYAVRQQSVQAALAGLLCLMEGQRADVWPQWLKKHLPNQ